MSKSLATSIIAVVCIVVIALAIGGYLYFSGASNGQLESDLTQIPKSDDISAWKTYVNPKYGYSIKYPPEWTINTPPVGDGILIGNSEPNDDQISIAVTSKQPSSGVYDRCQQVSFGTVLAQRCESIYTVGSERGVVYATPIMAKGIDVVILHNQLYYIFHLRNIASSDKFRIFDQMLSTVKFAK